VHRMSNEQVCVMFFKVTQPLVARVVCCGSYRYYGNIVSIFICTKIAYFFLKFQNLLRLRPIILTSAFDDHVHVALLLESTERRLRYSSACRFISI